MPSPIADLSYRNYDGPLMPPANRWWAIARMSMMLAVKKKGFWFWAGLSAIWYIFLIPILYFIDLGTAALPGATNSILSSIVWKDQFLNAFSISQMFLLIIALVIGAGTIANDNRANALLVYLSKPCTKLDYLVGKWLGIFVPFFAISAAPAIGFYAYGFMSYRAYGFVTQDPWLFPKLVAMSAIPGVVHASLCLGISSLFNQGRLAGATYAGIYFMSLFFTKAMQVINAVSERHHEAVPNLVQRLFYCSVDGIQIGFAKMILGTHGSPIIPGPQRFFAIPQPPAFFIIAMLVVPCGISLAIAWNRVRAVEVVG